MYNLCVGVVLMGFGVDVWIYSGAKKYFPASNCACYL